MFFVLNLWITALKSPFCFLKGAAGFQQSKTCLLELIDVRKTSQEMTIQCSIFTSWDWHIVTSHCGALFTSYGITSGTFETRSTSAECKAPMFLPFKVTGS